MDISSVKVSTLLIQESTSTNTNLFSIWTIANGSAKIKTFWGDFHAKPLDIFTTLPSEDITILPERDFVILQVEISDKLMQDAFDGSFSSIFCNSCLGMDCKRLHTQIIKLVDAYYCNANSSWSLQLKSYTYDLLYILKNSFTSYDSLPYSGVSNQFSRQYQIAQYLSLHYREPITLNAVAEQFHLTPQYFSKYFKRTFGENFLTYLRNLRLDDATKMLLMSNKSITSVAFECGFPNLTAFNKAFREKFGISPRAFITQHSKDKDSSPPHSAYELDDSDAIALLHSHLSFNESGADETNAEGHTSYEQTVSVSNMTPIYNSWNEIINVGSAELCLNSVFQQQFRDCAKTQNIQTFRYVRILNIFSPAVFPSGLEGDNVGFQNFDRIVNFFLSTGCKLMFELGPKPDKEIFSPQLQIVKGHRHFPNEAIEAFTERLLHHCVNYWGAEEVNTWRFESWLPQIAHLRIRENAPDAYFSTFVHTYQDIKAVCPDAEVGGMGLNINLQTPEIAEKAMLKIKNCSDVSPDFISLYAYPAYIGSLDPATQSLKISAMLRSDTHIIQDKLNFWYNMIHSIFPDSKIYITEYSSDVSSRFSVNESCNKAAYIAEFVIDNFDSVNGMGYWFFSDLTYESYNTTRPLFGGNGLVSRDGLKKSGYYVFQFLSKMGNRLIAKGKNYMVTSRADNKYELLIHNHKNLSSEYCTEYFKNDTMVISNNYFEDIKKLQFDLTLTGLSAGTYLIKKYSINNSNSLLHGLNCLNDTRMLHREEFEYLHGTCVPTQRLDYVSCESEIKLSSTLEPDEVTLFLIIPSTDD